MSQDDLGRLAPPEWLCEHPEIKRRGIELVIPLKPFCAWRTSYESTPPYAVKLIRPQTAEAEIYERLHRLDPASPNHTLPCDIIRSEAEQPFLIMPCLEMIIDDPAHWRWELVPLLDYFHQVIEGIEFLHNLNIAHMDIYVGQIVIVPAKPTAFHKEVQAGKVYIIDFDTSIQFDKGPGHQHAVDLPECNCKPPPGITRFDPYSWDVYCTGKLFEHQSEFVYKLFKKRQVPWVLRRYIEWLIGNERGCAAVCHCRPTARRARQVLGVLRFAARVWERVSWIVSHVRDLCKALRTRQASYQLAGGRRASE